MKPFAFSVAVIFLISICFAQGNNDTISPELQKIQRDILGNPSPILNPTVPTAEPAAQAKEILSNPLYRESLDTSKGESWLGQALENLFNKVGDWISRFFRQKEQPQSGGLGASPLIIQGIIAILLAILAGFLIFMIAQIRLKRKLPEEDVEGLISNEEAKRSADQWIKEADRLSGEGLFREAIRCLYLACLVRMDEQLVLRFQRHETNWEHLLRFRDLATKPGSFDLHPATQKFDNAWYGLVPQDQNDVNWFKSEYQTLLDGLRQARS